MKKEGVLRRSSRLASQAATTDKQKRRREEPINQPEVKSLKLMELEPRPSEGGRLLGVEQRYWKKGLKYIVGVDEAGRGPLAGPVVVAACSIQQSATDVDSTLIDDSKIVDEATREQVFSMLISSRFVDYAIEVVSVEEIDEKNILRATLSGMDRAVDALRRQGKCDVALIDGPFIPPEIKKNMPTDRSEAIKGGDGKVRAIAAASILAKVTRDRLMRDYHRQFPEYGFDKHKGYPVPAHVAALTKHGPCGIHRLTFAPVQRALQALAILKSKAGK